MNDGIARANSAWPTRLPARELLCTSGIAALADDQLLCCLLECHPITDVGLERLLTNVRSAMLATASRRGSRRRAASAILLCRGASVLHQRIRLLDDRDRSRRRARAASGARASDWRWRMSRALADRRRRLFSATRLAGADALLAVVAALRGRLARPADQGACAGTPDRGDDSASDRGSTARCRTRCASNTRKTPIRAGSRRAAGTAPHLRTAARAAPDVLIAGCGTGLSTVELARQHAPPAHPRHRSQPRQPELRQAHGAEISASPTSNSRRPTS